MILELLVLILAYILGSIPFGVVLGKIVKSIDVRELGSGSMGMTNVIRTVGIYTGIAVLILDMLKSILAIYLAILIVDSSLIVSLSGVLAITGHIWPVFSKFRGGKGTACGWAGLLFLSPISGLIASIVGLFLIAITRYVSLGSITASVVGSIFLVILCLTGNAPLPYMWFGVLGTILIAFRHKDNILRLIKGQERKLGQKI
ncbi:MAG: acyl-phosphate glycerol 3-phosphate acyltransferase [Chloroflexi bacterium]|jgi:glycerol-3-phosphate acyltransferase PlsY|nr:acyl-phosphate glycerol 3-phosphate acyltransferase [Chloroflexota bacterium]MCH2304344.1 glycerol-3-phosphate 1-O-acyltransferase PlsY [SAR202 cluster bacterium]|tara:strand:- start:32169 stop:32774 length:606 start_codon:yes stop_codon:yes gene_type:complete